MTWLEFISRLTANHDQNWAKLKDGIRSANLERLSEVCEVITSKTGDPMTDTVRALAQVGLSGILVEIVAEKTAEAELG